MMKRLLVFFVLCFLLIGTVSASVLINTTNSKGGVFNGGFETGSGTATTASWVGSENYGWFAYISGATNVVSYDGNFSHSGTKSLKIYGSVNTGFPQVSTNADGSGSMPASTQKYAIPVKAGSTYKMSGWIKTDSLSSTTNVKISYNTFNSAYSTVTQGSIGSVSSTQDWTFYSTTFTAGAGSIYLQIVPYSGFTSGTAWFDDITLEEVVTDTQATGYTVKPVIQGVTSVDNIDQSQLVGTDNNIVGSVAQSSKGQTFVATKSKLTSVSLPIYQAGSALSDSVMVSIRTTSAGLPTTTILASNTILGSTLSSTPSYKIIDIPAILTPGETYAITLTRTGSGDDYSYYYINSTTTAPYAGGSFVYANDGSTWAADTSKDVVFKTLYAKNTEDASITVNGVNLNVSTNDATGLLSGATVDLDKGMYNWTSGVSYDAGKLSDVYYASRALSTEAWTTLGLNNWFYHYNLGFLEYSSISSITPHNITYKVNTMLPTNGVEVASKIYTTQDVDKTIMISPDNIAWTTISTVRGTSGTFITNVSFTHAVDGYSTFYVKMDKGAVSDYLDGNVLWINATLNTTTTNQTVLTVNPGTNYYNLSSNGKADSASLDPSLMMNVLLMGTPTFGVTSNFSSNVTGGQSPLAVQFTDTSTNVLAKIDTWNWIFGDQGAGNTSTLQNPSHTYTTNGTHTVNLTIANTTYNLKSTKLSNIVVNNTVQADFVGAPLSGYATTDVYFVDFSTNEGIYAWLWNFGDGGTSTTRNPTHSYTAGGSYNVSLTVTSTDGTDTKTELNYVTITGVTDINPTSTYRFKPDVNVISNSTRYNRTIEMGNVNNATYALGSTTFDASNIRVMRVLANKTTYSDISLVESTINNTTGVATFNVTRPGGFAPEAAFVPIVDVEMFYYSYKAGTTGAAWGTGYLINGTYKNTFAVTTLTDTPLTYDWVTHSNFTISNTAPVSGVTVVTLTPSDRPEAADRFLWAFGDGQSFLSYNRTGVTHVYTMVTPVITPLSPSLTAYLSANSSVTNTTTFVNGITPTYPAEFVQANFTSPKTNVGSAEVVNFEDVSIFGNSSAVRKYNWSFGDGSYSSTVGDVQHIYTYYGIYTVQLRVSNNDYPTLGNSTLARTDYIQVSVDNTGAKLNVLYPREVQFSLVDTIGTALPNVGVAIVMENNTISNTNWFTTLFGISTDASPLDTTILTGTSDSDGSITFPLVASGKYMMAFNSTQLGISETRTVYPQQVNYVFVLHPNAALIPNQNNYINGTLYVIAPNESYANLHLDYTDLSASTTSVSFYVDYSNHTRLSTQTFAGINATAYTMVPNVAAQSYVFGYFANTSMFGNVSASQGIMMKGITGKMVNLDPCGGYARGWGSQC